ncbi:MAG: hypothetical protein QME52_08485 [Bacteroidota bacterium]|nr:hypothetical protein [Bacteroidota bacterium]
MRVKWTYPQLVMFPSRFKKFLWEHPNYKAPLEKLIYRIFTYGNFTDLQWLYKKYPNEAFSLSKKYSDIKRGVKFWMEYWYGQRI